MSARVLGLDVGDRTVGVAVSDETGTVALGLHTLRRTRDLSATVAEVAALVQQYGVGRLVVGWPLQLDGQPGAQARKVVGVAQALKAALGLPIERFDERLTTVAAERALLEGNVRRAERKAVIDTVAATLILQGWLDRRANRRAGAAPTEAPVAPEVDRGAPAGDFSAKAPDEAP